MANSADPDQLASSDLDLHCLQRQCLSGFGRTRVKRMLFRHFAFSGNKEIGTSRLVKQVAPQYGSFLL